jgi:hypothetical protein
MRQAMGDEQKKVLTLATVGLLFAVGLSLVVNRDPVARYRSDIYLRWYALEKLFTEDRNLYDSRNGEEVLGFVWGEQGPVRNTNFYYPAHLVILIGPLALLPYSAAHVIWTVTGQVFYLVAVWIAMRLVRWPPSINQKTAFIVAAVLFLPQLQHAIWGQFNTIAVLSLVLAYSALRRGRFGLAGILTLGLTFMPHVTLLTLVFFFIWALFKRDRWRFFAGFGLAALLTWAVAEFLQPGWVLDFWKSIGEYVRTRSVVDTVWNPHQFVAVALCLAAVVLFLRNRRASASSSGFAGCIVLSLAVWFLVVPVVGMMHVVILPVAVVLLLASLRMAYPRLYRYGLYAALVIYMLGIVGFLYGLSSPEIYGRHIEWAEAAYKVAAPILLGLFSLPLCLDGKRGRVITQ